jgi:transposase
LEGAMRVRTSKSKNGTRYYIIKTYYDTKGVEHSITVEKLGLDYEIKEKTGRDPAEYAKERAQYLTQLEKEKNKKISVDFSPASIITKNHQYSFNVGYLFLQQIYYELGLDKICASISKNSGFEYALNDILQKLCYGRILEPTSKAGTYSFSKTLLEQPTFDQHHVYRSLNVLSENFDYIQSELFKNSLKVMQRNTGVIYYDCTNFFFEIEEEDADGLCKYGKSKEHRPNPIVSMGLFIDKDGIPISLCINPGNTNDQVTMRPLEKKMLKDFGMSKFVVCTDSGLCSNPNKRYNSLNTRGFITTHSLKKVKQEVRETALNPEQWYLMGSKTRYKKYNLNEINENEHKDSVFYKEIPIDNDEFYERLIVTYSLKYKDYMRNIRADQIARAEEAIKTGRVKKKKSSNDFNRFIGTINYTKDGEVAEKTNHYIDEEVAKKEAIYDGFYAVSTNLNDDDPSGIVAASHERWQIEQCFRILKSEFKSRPVYVSTDDHIKAHFLTCFISLILYKCLEKKMHKEFTCEELVGTLRNMLVREIVGEGYIPNYTRTDLTDKLHETFGFRTDYHIVTKENMKKIISTSKKRKSDAKKVK